MTCSDSTPVGGGITSRKGNGFYSDEEEEDMRHSSKQFQVPSVSRRVPMKMSQNNADKDDQTSTSKKTISLPISRVRLIMKSSPDVSSINQDALFLTTKATVSCRSMLNRRCIKPQFSAAAGANED